MISEKSVNVNARKFKVNEVTEVNGKVQFSSKVHFFGKLYSGRNFALLEFRQMQNLGPKISRNWRNSQYIITYIT